MGNALIPDSCVICAVVMLLLFCVNVAIRWLIDSGANRARKMTNRFAEDWRHRMDEQYGRNG